MDCFAVRMPPAGLNPTSIPVCCAYSRMARVITKPTGKVAFVGSLPVEVLMKSAPAIIATTLARATLRNVSRSPVPRITFVETALHALEGSGVHVAAVSTGFPAGLSPLAERVAEIRRSVEAGAHEIDVVITRAHVFGGRWQALYDEVAAFKQACGSAATKVILGAGDLLTLRNVGRASRGAMLAGADLR